MTVRWGVKWNGNIMWQDCNPLLFDSREKARIYIDANYGYIRKRADLRRPPFNWRMPKAVKIEVSIKEIK